MKPEHFPEGRWTGDDVVVVTDATLAYAHAQSNRKPDPQPVPQGRLQAVTALVRKLARRGIHANPA